MGSNDCAVTSVAEPYHVDAAPARDKNFDAAPAALGPTLVYVQYTKLTFL
jgi:hypothetical protein